MFVLLLTFVFSLANIPGKPKEALNYSGGIPLYDKECREALNNGFEGFQTQAPDAAGRSVGGMDGMATQSSAAQA